MGRTNAKAAGTVLLNADRLIEARKRAGLSRERLAELARGELSISAATIKRAETGRPVHLDTARILARLLAVPLDELFAFGDASRASSTSPEPPSGESVRQPPLAGRRDELAQMHAALARARAGKPALLFLVGEPGIGKTRLLRELCMHAQRQALACGLGQGLEHLGLPFSAIVEALAPLQVSVAAGDAESADAIRQFLAGGCVPGQAEQREQNRLMLFRTLSRALRVASARAPLLICVDDLHWVDQGSLELFEHLAHSAAEAAWRGERCGLLLMATIRTQTQRTLVAERFARLCREPICERLELKGLAPAETFELLTGLSIARPSHALTNTVHETTAGNPLFVQEVVRLLRERGHLHERAGWTVIGETSPDACLPESATAALLERTGGLSEGCRRALAYGACFGTRFELGTLAYVMNADPLQALEAVEEATREGLLDSRGQSFAFAHPLVRKVCLQLVIGARRQRIHHDIALRLRERHGESGDTHLHEIAHHLIEAGPLADARMVFEYAARAGRAAEAASAWDAAARFYAAALRTPFAEQGRRAELQMQAALAYCNSWELGRALEHYAAAEQEYEQLGDICGKTRALNDRTSLAFSAGLPHSTDALAVQLAQLGDTNPGLSAAVMNTLSDCWLPREPERAGQLAAEAFRIAVASRDDALAARVSNSLALYHLRALQLPEALEMWTRGHGYAQAAGEPLLVSRYLQRMPLALGPLGQIEQLEQRASEAWSYHERYPNLGESSLILHARAWLAVVRGRLTEAVHLAGEAISVVRRSNYVLPAPLVLPTLACACTLEGRFEEGYAALQQLQDLLGPDDPAVRGALARFRGLIAAHEGGVPLLEADGGGSKRPRGLPDLPKVARLCAQVESAAMTGGSIDAEWYRQLLAVHERGVLFTNTWVFALPRVLGVAAGLLGEFGAADRHFEESLRVTEALDAKPEHARTCLDYATLLARRGIRERHAEELARKARSTFTALQMAPLARRARALFAL